MDELNNPGFLPGQPLVYKKEVKKSRLWIWILVVIVLIVLGVVVYYLISGSSTDNPAIRNESVESLEPRAEIKRIYYETYSEEMCNPFSDFIDRFDSEGQCLDYVDCLSNAFSEVIPNDELVETVNVMKTEESWIYTKINPYQNEDESVGEAYDLKYKVCLNESGVKF